MKLWPRLKTTQPCCCRQNKNQQRRPSNTKVPFHHKETTQKLRYLPSPGNDTPGWCGPSCFVFPCFVYLFNPCLLSFFPYFTSSFLVLIPLFPTQDPWFSFSLPPCLPSLLALAQAIGHLRLLISSSKPLKCGDCRHKLLTQNLVVLFVF